jgi:hypothetical protein
MRSCVSVVTQLGHMSFEFFDISTEAILDEPSLADATRTRIKAGGIGVVRQFIDQGLARDIRDYLSKVGQNSLPTYEPIEIGRPNFHRLNLDDERAHVRGCFHQFVFYPWNQDIFDLFQIFENLFRLKNLITGNSAERFIGRHGEDGVVSRLAFQFYPSGKGFLNRHQDPHGEHQLTVPTVCFSEKPHDFQAGGAFVEDDDGSRHYLDDRTAIGDVVFFDARLVHGVESIDPGVVRPWLDFVGRWTCLIATNKVAGNHQISNAIDLGKQQQ